MDKTKSTKGKLVMYKTLHGRLRIEQHEPTKLPDAFSCFDIYLRMKWPIDVLFDSSLMDNGNYWNHIFTAPWCRVSSYCVGILLAFTMFIRIRLKLDMVCIYCKYFKFVIYKFSQGSMLTQLRMQLLVFTKKSLKIPKGRSEAVN